MVRREQPFDGICSPQVFGPYFRSRRAALLENGDWSRALDEEFRKRGLETILEEAWVVSRGEGRVNRAAEPGLEGPGQSCKEEEEKESSQLHEVSRVRGGPSSFSPWQGCCHQLEKVSLCPVSLT